MLEHKKLSAVCSTDHEGVKTESGHWASVLATDVDKDGACCLVGAVDIVLPEALFVGCSALIVEMVDFSIEPALSEVGRIHNREISLWSVCGG